MDPNYFRKITCNHETFKEKSIWWLKDNGFTVEPYGYEDVLDKDAVNILMHDESEEAMEIRHRPDTKVTKNGFECLIDWKAQQKKWPYNPSNLSIDAIPFYYDYKLTDRGDYVMIAYEDIFYSVEKGFFVDCDWCPWQIWYPTKNKQYRKPRECEFIKQAFNEIGREIGRPIKHLDVETTLGSGSPYVLILGSAIQRQQNWKDLLRLNT